MLQLLGNERLLGQLKNAVAEGRAAHAYLLCGAAGSGKRTLASILAQMLMCPDHGCDKCTTCQKLQKGVHPDLIWVKGVGKNGMYSIDQIRNIRNDALVYPNECHKKVYIFENVEKMRHEAQDAFLKILEEPPAFVVFILLCADESKMLSTIHSRVIRLALEMPDETVTLQWLRNKSDADDALLRTAIGVAGGNPGGALALLEGGGLEQGFARCETFCRTLLTGSSYDLAAFSHTLAADKEGFAEFLQMLSLYLRDILIYKTTGDTALMIFEKSVLSLSGALARMHTESIPDVIDELTKLAYLATQPISILLLENRLVTLVKEELV